MMKSSLLDEEVQWERDDIPGRVKANVKKVMAPMRNCGARADVTVRLLCEVPYWRSLL